MYDDPPASVEVFCERYVQPMAEESDNIHIVGEWLVLCLCCGSSAGGKSWPLLACTQ